MKPYYHDADNGITIYHGDCREILPTLRRRDLSVLVTDPPYAIAYRSNQRRLEGNARSIANDTDTTVRDAILEWWGTDRPSLVFGSPRVPKPAGTRGVLVWDKGGALGMGDLSMPWKFDHEEVYVLGRGFVGRRDSGSVLRVPPEQSIGRDHPHRKPVTLMELLLQKCPPGVVIDPCMGVGPTLRAAKNLGQPAIGIELDERYCELAVERIGQEVMRVESTPERLIQEPLDLGGAA